MKKVFVTLVAALSLASCLNSPDYRVEGSKEYTYHGDLVTTVVDTQQTAYDSRTETTEDGQPKKYELQVSLPDINVQRIDLTFNGIKFMSRMPELVITMPQLTYEVATENGVNVWTINKESVIPTIAGAEFPSYEMRNVVGRLTATEADISFDITVSGKEYHAVYSTSMPQ